MPVPERPAAPASALEARWLVLSVLTETAPPLVIVTLLPIDDFVSPVEIATAIAPAIATFLPVAPAIASAVGVEG